MVKLVSKENLEYYTLRVKNKFSEIRDDLDKFKTKATTYEKVTYAELVTKRQNRQLTAGGMYRIVDYETTVANDEEARSAGHVFDLIVRAISSDTLSEEAYAIQSERDTDGYFSDANLNAWQVWYCLDNDTTRFQWADEENGKGVIYRLIDEWRNDCPYDFKNVQFKRCYTYGDFVDEVVDGYDWENTHYILSPSMDRLANMYVDVEEEDFEWFYTFTYYKGFTDVIDASLIHEIEDNSIGYGYEACHSNEMKSYYITKTIDDTIYQAQALNNIVITSTDSGTGGSVKLYSNKWGTSCYNMTFHEHCYENRFGLRCSNIIGFKLYNNTFGNDCGGNTFGNDCGGNTFGNGCGGNTFGNNCYDNTFGNDCSSSTFGNTCGGNTFGNDCVSNTFGTRYHYNTFGNDCGGNTFGNDCYKNTFGNDCDHNTFGNNCYNNTFGNSCYTNTFGNDCNHNTFGNNCYHNTFGNNCYHNTFGNDCNDNTFGNDCSINTFGNDCISNTFGEGCEYNTFENDCHGNTLGTYCNYHTFGNGCFSNTFGNDCFSNTFGNGCFSNTFGNDCGGNTFGNNCGGNTFGNDCNDNTFGNDCGGNTFGNNCEYITAGEDVIYLDVTGGTSNNQRVQNAYILNGTKGKGSSNRLTVTLPVGSKVYHYVGLNSKGELKIWTPADLVE